MGSAQGGRIVARFIRRDTTLPGGCLPALERFATSIPLGSALIPGRLRLCYPVLHASCAGEPACLSARLLAMRLTVEIDREDDGRWIAEVLELPGTLVYGSSREDALASAKALALRVLADTLEHGEAPAELQDVFPTP